MAAAGTISAEKSPGGAGQRCHTAGGGTHWNRRALEPRLSFRAQRCAKGGGTAHALPPPGTPARGPAERAVTGTAELKQRDRGVQIERQES